MGQGHSTTKNSQQQTSKYAPRESPGASVAPTTKHKKRGGSRSGSTKSTKAAVASTNLPPAAHGGSSKKGARSAREDLPPSLYTVPTQHQSRPPTAQSEGSLPSRSLHQVKRTSSLTHHQPTNGHHRSQDRKSNAPPSLPSLPFSLGGGGPFRHTLIQGYFNSYKEEGEDVILARGMEQFCIDLHVDPTEFIVLVLAWKFEASQMCRFTREEFINGCQKMEAHDSKSLRNRFPQLLQDARTDFKDLYQFTFSFGLDHSSGQRSLPTEMAIQLWELVFSQDKPPILDRWFRFLEKSDTRGISRDTWNMFLDFCQSVVPDLSNYDESEAWPSLFDDFVECELANGGTTSS